MNRAGIVADTPQRWEIFRLF